MQTCSGDPNVDSNWQFVGMFSGGKATVGIKGIMGVWNDPAKITVV